MITSQQTGLIAEAYVVAYASECGVQTPDDVRKALEMLISKSALAIKKHAGPLEAVQVLQRTQLHVAPPGGQA